MVDFCKIAFHILSSGMVVLGLLIAIIGFYGPSLLEDKETLNIRDNTKKYDQEFKAAFFGLAIAGLVVVGLAIIGIIAVCRRYKLILMILCIILIIIAVLLLIFAGLASAAVYLRVTAFKKIWRPKMEKYASVSLDLDVITTTAEVNVLQMRLGCCGLSGEDVYAKHKDLPLTCCGKFPTLAGCTRDRVKQLKREGCDLAQSKELIVMAMAISCLSAFTGLYLIAVVILACCVKRSLK